MGFREAACDAGPCLRFYACTGVSGEPTTAVHRAKGVACCGVAHFPASSVHNGELRAECKGGLQAVTHAVAVGEFGNLTPATGVCDTITTVHMKWARNNALDGTTGRIVWVLYMVGLERLPGVVLVNSSWRGLHGVGVLLCQEYYGRACAVLNEPRPGARGLLLQ